MLFRQLIKFVHLVTRHSSNLNRPIVTHYNMNNRRTGIAMIFNHETYDINLPPRLGTNQDVSYLKVVLKKLGFEIKVYQNLNVSAIQKRIAEVAKDDHTDYDCFVMVVLTHGDGNDVLYANDTCYSSEKLWLPFSADSCPTLKDKPKLFFIQACRGEKCMPSVTLTNDGLCKFNYKIPSYPNFLFAHASAPGYISMRNTETGTWFIQALCRELERNAYEYDILSLLTFVIQNVAIDCEAYLDEHPNLGEQKQNPCVTSSLTRLVQFNRKFKTLEAYISKINI